MDGTRKTVAWTTHKSTTHVLDLGPVSISIYRPGFAQDKRWRWACSDLNIWHEDTLCEKEEYAKDAALLQLQEKIEPIARALEEAIKDEA